MPEQTITFEFSRLETVRIKEVGTKGLVITQSHGPMENQFRVLFWMDGNRKDEWFYEHELEEVK